MFCNRWPNLLNACVESLNLKELELSGRKFTWASSGSNPTFENLDKILVSTKWEQKFHLSTMEALSRNISDHTQLLLQTSEPSHRGNNPRFKFELGWLYRDGFHDMVIDMRGRETRGRSPMEKW
jgi:hypothetical protein